MTSQVLGHQTDGYQVTTEVYEGPLDLLLQLIERAELDITRLALAQVTDQYLAHLRGMKEQDAAEVSAFLVIAAKLVQIKSEALLPRPPERQPGEEDPAESLAQQLIIYRRFKQAAAWLTRREASGEKTHLRLAPPPRMEGKLDLTGITLNDLVYAAWNLYNSGTQRFLNGSIITLQRITIRERIRTILSELKAKGQASMRRILGDKHTRIDAVVTFLAILELVKRRVIEVRQDQLFDDIGIQPVEEWNPGDEFELEFED